MQFTKAQIADVIDTIIDHRGLTPKKLSADWIDSGVQVISAMNIKEGRLNISITQNFVTQEIFKRWMPEKLKYGDILMTSEAPLGAVAIFKEECDFCLGQRLFGLRAKISKLDQQYFFWTLQTPLVQNQLIARSTGTTAKGIRQSELLQVEIPLPPLKEQRRLATILDKADAVRKKRQQAIQLTEDLLRAAFLEMFGNPVTNSKGWEVIELRDLLTFITSGSRGWAAFYASEGQLFLRVQNVKGGRLLLDDIAYVNPPDSVEARRTCVQQGDVLFSITADLGRTAVIPKDLPTAYINQHLAILRVNKERISPTYLSAFLSSEGGQLQVARLNREGVKAGLNFDDIKGLKILIPPIKTQQEYENCFQRIICTSNSYKQSYYFSNYLFNSLMHRAFQGEL